MDFHKLKKVLERYDFREVSAKLSFLNLIFKIKKRINT